jgi:hypothetical protein
VVATADEAQVARVGVHVVGGGGAGLAIEGGGGVRGSQPSIHASTAARGQVLLLVTALVSAPPLHMAGSGRGKSCWSISWVT